MSGQAQAAADKDAGIDRYRILATLDLRTSEICREMDGQEFDYDDMKVGENFPPFHPFCRTTVLSVLDDMDLSLLQRKSRDPVTGKVKTFPGDMTYKQWYEKEVAHNPEALFAEKVAKNRTADLKQYERYKDRLGKEKVGKNIDTFRDLKYNKPEKWEEVRTEYLDHKLKERLRSSETNKTIHEGKQGKHIIGHNNYTEGRSYLNINMDEIQELVNKYAGTGRIIRSGKDGRWQNKEKIVLDHDIGQFISSYEDLNEPTNAVMIVYSKDGTHIIPARRE